MRGLVASRGSASPHAGTRSHCLDWLIKCLLPTYFSYIMERIYNYIKGGNYVGEKLHTYGYFRILRFHLILYIFYQSVQLQVWGPCWDPFDQKKYNRFQRYAFMSTLQQLLYQLWHFHQIGFLFKISAICTLLCIKPVLELNKYNR